MPAALECVVVKAIAKHTATVIFLHGLGDSGIGWLFLVEELAPKFPFIKWVLPNAPLKKLIANDGALTPAWFNIHSFQKSDNSQQVDSKGMVESTQAVNALIQAEMDGGISSERIIIGGFSQGCVVSLLTGFSTQYKLAGVIGCSGWLGVIAGIEDIRADTNKQTPFLLCHGDEDLVVKAKYGQATAKYLRKIGFNVAFKLYPGLGHAAGYQELEDITDFIREQLPEQPHTSKL